MRTTAIAVLLLCVLPVIAQAQSLDISTAPEAIQKLSTAIQGMKPAEMRTAILTQLGPAHREIGSGFRIEQWDTAGGTLTFHPTTGPTFVLPDTKYRIRLLRTNNPVGTNLLKSYEMTTTPDPANHGTKLWLGNLEFGPDSTYRFKDSGQFPAQREKQAANFFFRHPAGTFEVRLATPITAATLLESLAEGATIAHLVFTSADRKQQATFSITSSEQARRLAFSADTPLSFCMDTSWSSFWR